MSGALPPAWVHPRLSEIALINPPPARSEIADDAEVNFVPMRAVEPEGGGLLSPETRAYREVKKGYTSFLSGDVIMAKITPCMENGKVAVVPALPGTLCFGSTEFHVLRAECGVLARWMADFLLQHEIRRSAQRAMTGGVGQMRVPASFLEVLRIPLPPSEEQTRIADALAELFSDLDAAVEALGRVQAKLELYRASVLKAAVEGALTVEWRREHPDTEPASELLKRILAERRRCWEEEHLRRFAERGVGPPANWRAKYREPSPPDVRSLPTLPRGWCWASVDEVSAVVVDCPHSTPHFTASGQPCIDTTCVRAGRVVREHLRYVSPESYGIRVSRLAPKGGDVVFAREGIVGTAVIIPQDLEPCLGQRVMLMRADVCVLPEYFRHALESSTVRDQYRPKLLGSTVAHLNVADVKLLAIPLPPLAEQEGIVEAADEQLSLIEHLESEMEVNSEGAGALRQSILRRAFSGRLVPQDPNDEPASVLLERIVTERECRARKNGGAPRKGKGKA